MNGKSEYEKLCYYLNCVLEDADRSHRVLISLREKMAAKGRIDKREAFFEIDSAASSIPLLKKVAEDYLAIIQGKQRLDLEHPRRISPIESCWKNIDQAEILRQARDARQHLVQFLDGLCAKVKGSEMDEERSTCLVTMLSAWTALDRHIQMLEAGCLRKDRRVPFAGQPQLRLVAGGRGKGKVGEEVVQ